MCCSNFNTLSTLSLTWTLIVITIENFRSDEKLRSLFRERVKYGVGPDYGRISLESSLAVHRFPWENIRGRISYCMNDNFHSKVLKTVKNLHLKELTACDSSESIFKSVMCGMQAIIAYKPFANKESSPEDAQRMKAANIPGALLTRPHSRLHPYLIFHHHISTSCLPTTKTIMRFLNVVFTVIALVFLLSVQPHNAARVQQRDPVPPPSLNPCDKIPVGGPSCKNPPASPSRAHATAPAVKATMHK
ncbi:hypothetical protein CK203_082464 [Vitis vinifera]|uniref:Uncharacterized protein n=1 Tax=Vitis vinifera TaxID=29760 RepID=A0A438BNI0_VITVI|nr:hypothetical protein CK203_082464 [Vitis vinifera]